MISSGSSEIESGDILVNVGSSIGQSGSLLLSGGTGETGGSLNLQGGIGINSMGGKISLVSGHNELSSGSITLVTESSSKSGSLSFNLREK